jgi:glycosyltransferase involved in cell wall biosynthesis
MKPSPDKVPPFSIVVPVYNSASTLSRCLSTLTQQDYPADKVEVIVVDDGSTDNTVEIARQFLVRLLQLETNQGRIVARNSGAQAARFDRILFVDSRVVFPADGLKRVIEVDYLPQIFFVHHTHNEGYGWFNRSLMLIHRRYYRPILPFTPQEAATRQNYYLTPENFLRAFKGTTALAIERETWLACQPENQGKHQHDDGAILRRIVQHRPLFQRYDIVITYFQREKLTAIIPHRFLRGPRFASYYLRPDGAFRKLWIIMQILAVLLLIGILATVVVFDPLLALLSLLTVGFTALLIAGLFLAQRPSDVLVVMALLPILVGSFGAGLLWGTLVLRQARTTMERRGA